MWTKLMSSSSSKKSTSSNHSAGERDQEELSMAARRPNKPRRSLNVDEEYTKAFRTKSYIDLYSEMHHQLARTSTRVAAPKEEDQDEADEAQRLQHAHSSPSPLASGGYDDCIPNFLLKPSQDSLRASTSGSTPASCGRFHRHLNSLLLDFFDITHQASTACASLLSSINHARYHHKFIHHLLAKLSTSQHNQLSTFSQLSSHLEVDNPLSSKHLSHFNHIHSLYPSLIRRLTSAHRKISRRLKLVKFTKKASGCAMIGLLGTVVVAAVIIVTHAAAAVAIAPVAMAAGGFKGMGKRVRGWMKLERAKARVDSAAKGAYIVGRDFDTMSRMVRRVHDEVEHGRDVARMVTKNREWGMVKEVVKEMEGRGGELGLGFEEQLEELEKHVYLCLNTINRSRRLVAQDMMELQEA